MGYLEATIIILLLVIIYGKVCLWRVENELEECRQRARYYYAEMNDCSKLNVPNDGGSND